MLVGALGIWPTIVGIKDRGKEWQRIGEYGGGRIEEIMNFANNLKEEENLELLN